jgi:hypothetical protein
MDYPAPLATVDDAGNIVLSDAYDTGIGDWDKFTIQYGYTDYPDGTDEREALGLLVDEYVESGLLFLTDSDARPAGGADPRANLWDNGGDVVQALRDEMRVRALALDRFGVATIRPGRPMTTLEEVLVPLYLHHRYQINATVKALGGTTYAYGLRGDALPLPESVPAGVQREALEALLETLTPAALALPPQVRTGIPPRTPGFGQHRELFGGYTGLIFDPYAPAEVIAGQVLGLIAHPERAARLVNQADFDPELPALEEVLSDVTASIWEGDVARDPYQAELQRIVQQVWTDALLSVAADAGASSAVRARVTQHLRELHFWIEENPGDERDHETLAHRYAVFDQIDRFIFREYEPSESYRGVTTPPGDPIGQNASGWTRFERTAIPGTDGITPSEAVDKFEFQARQTWRRSAWDYFSDVLLYCATGE